MKLKLEFFKEYNHFSYNKWYSPIGKVFNYIEDYKGRIYETHWSLSTPIGSIRLTAMPYSR
jgi:hypothetical protein